MSDWSYVCRNVSVQESPLACSRSEQLFKLENLLLHDIFMCFMLVLVIIEICGQLSKIGSGSVNEFLQCR